MTTANIKVLITDDEDHMRDYIKSIVLELGYSIVAEAADGNKAVALYNDLKPDIMLLAINIPFQNGIEVLKQVISSNPEACIIIVTAIADVDTVKQCIDLGARGYIRKDNSPIRIKEIIQETWQEYLSKEFKQRTI